MEPARQGSNSSCATDELCDHGQATYPLCSLLSSKVKEEIALKNTQGFLIHVKSIKCLAFSKPSNNVCHYYQHHSSHHTLLALRHNNAVKDRVFHTNLSCWFRVPTVSRWPREHQSQASFLHLVISRIRRVTMRRISS